MGARDGEIHSTLSSPHSIKTVDGGFIDLSQPETWSGSLKSISVGLSNVCRYAGQIPKFYSVGEHSVRVASMLTNVYGEDDPIVMAGLLHDAHEAFYGDVPTPMKKLIQSEFWDLHDRFDRVVEKWARLPERILEDERVHWADRMIFQFEWPYMWGDDKPLSADEWFLEPDAAAAAFDRTFLYLYSRINGQQEFGWPSTET